MKKVLVVSLLLNGFCLAAWFRRDLAVEAQVAGGRPGESCGVENGDVNGDGGRDISDGIYILSWLFSGGPEPVPACDQGIVKLTLSDLHATGNCMPVVPPDPWTLTWELEVVNSTGKEVDVALDSARIVFGDPAQPAFASALAAEPTSVKVGAGAIVRFSFNKTSFSTPPGCALCGKPVQLSALYRVNGVLQPEPALASATAQCAF